MANSVDLTFEELGYGTFQLEESISKLINLYLPSNLAPNNEWSYLDLTISHAPPEPDKLSAIKAALNDIPLAVITLSPENAELTTHRFSFRDAPLHPGRNRLDITLDAGTTCNIRGAIVDVAVYKSSSFHVEYSMTRYSPDLALYPAPFFEYSFKYDPVYVVLPDGASATDLSAAATIAAGLGKFSTGKIRLASVLDTQVSADILSNYHIIVIGKQGANRLLEELELPMDLDDSALSGEQGVIQELVSPWNPLRMVLVVTGRSDEALSKASQALNRDVHLVGMQGPIAIVKAVLPPEPVGAEQRGADFTLADLGYDEEVVYGTRPHTVDYRFYMPLTWAVTEQPQFTLYFGHARIADPTSSSLDIYFNNVPIDSVLLDEGNASEGTLGVTLPSWLIRSGINEVRVSVEMNLEDEDKCLFLDSQHLWTAIYSHSYFRVPFVSEDMEPSLDLFPYPFNRRPSLSGLLVVLPDRPTQSDYDLMLEVAAELGAADWGNALALDVTTAEFATQEDRRDKDLILMGRPSVHSVIGELNDWLPQPFELDTDMVSFRLESVGFVQDPSRNIGLIEELPAPWDPERIILVLTGTTDDGVALASTTLFQGGARLGGNVVVIEESLGVQSFDTRSRSSRSESGGKGLVAGQTLLIQLGECWW